MERKNFTGYINIAPRQIERPRIEENGPSRMERRAEQITNLEFKLDNFTLGRQKRKRMESSLYALRRAQISYGNGKGKHHKEMRRRI